MERVRQIEALIQQIESSADPDIRARVRELVEAILEFHGAGLERILALADAPAVQSFARDDLVSSLLLLYGLHPEDFETRVRRATDAIPNIQLLGISEGVVHVRATGPATQEAVEQIIFAAAPETAAVRIEGAHPPSSFVSVEALLRA